MGSTATLFALGSLAIVGYVLGEVIGAINPSVAGKIKIMTTLLAISTVVDTVVSIYSKIKTTSGGLM